MTCGFVCAVSFLSPLLSGCRPEGDPAEPRQSDAANAAAEAAESETKIVDPRRRPRALTAGEDRDSDATVRPPEVDVDGDGRSGPGDRWVFEAWLARGGARANLEQQDVVSWQRIFNVRTPQRDAAASDSQRVTTDGHLTPPFARDGAVQVFAAFRDARLVGKPRGQVVAGGHLYVACAHDDPARAGVVRVSGIEDPDGTLPIPTARVTRVVAGLADLNLLAYDRTKRELVATTAGAKRTDVAIWRVRGLSAPEGKSGGPTRKPTACAVVEYAKPPRPDDPARLSAPYGIRVVAGDFACGAVAGDLLVSDSRPYRSRADTGCLVSVNEPRCGGEALVNRRYKGLEMPRGFDLGDFGGRAPWGIYFVDLAIGGSPWLVRRSTPEKVTRGCSFDAHSPPPHAAFENGADDLDLSDVVFDPYSPSLFVCDASDDGAIYRIPATTGDVGSKAPEAEAASGPIKPVLFVDGLRRPRGISFPRTGVLLVSEERTDTLTVVDGWRFEFQRGDVDGDEDIDATDLERLANWVLSRDAGAEPGCLDAADVDDDGDVDVADAVRLADFLSARKAQEPASLPAPFDSYGVDPTPDLLGCREYSAGRRIRP